MNRFSIAATIFALCCSSFAQAPRYQTTPTGFLSTEGGSWSTFGNYKALHTQIIDGTLGSSLLLIRGFALRHDYRPYNSFYGGGRRWSNVKIDLSKSDFSKKSTTFTLNQTSTPTRMFSAAVSFPTISGYPTTKPAKWLLNFPFTSVYLRLPPDDVCMDFRFSGGTLTNRGTWGNFSFYAADAVTPSQTAAAFNFSRSTGLGGGCRDSGNTNAAALSSFSYTYGDKFTKPAAFAGNTRIYQLGSNFGPSARVLTVLGFRANVAGVAFPGVSCNKIHVDLGFPFALLSQTANVRGSLLPTLFFTGFNGVKHNAAWTGLKVVTQAAWDDTRNKNLLISNAAVNSILTKPSGGPLKIGWHGTRFVNRSASQGFGTRGVLWRYTK
jgi:hypothetical protein